MTEAPQRKSLLNTAAVYVLSNVLGAAIPFVLMPVLTRRLVPADYGITAMFSTTLSVLGAFAGLSVHGAVSLRYFQRDGFDLREYVGTALSVLAISTGSLLILVFAFRHSLSSWIGIPENWLLAAVIVAGANFISQIRLVLWQSETQPFRYMVFQVASSLTNFASSIALVVIADLHYVGRLIAMTSTAALMAVIALVSLVRGGHVRFGFNGTAAVDAIRFGVPLIPHTIGALVITLADRFLVTKFAGVDHTGVYMVGAQIGMIIGILADAANKAYAPWVFAKLEHIDATAKQRIVRLTYVYFVAITALALALSAIAPWFLGFFVGPRFYGSARFVFWLAMAGAFQGMYFMVANFIYYAKKTELLASVTFVAGIANVTLNYFLIRSRGAIGAAEATCIAYLISFLGTWAVSARAYEMPWFGEKRR